MGKFVKFAVIGLIVLSILMVFSASGIRSMESWARDRPDTSVGQSLPYTLGKISYFTFRYSMAKDIYEANIDAWPDHPKTAEANFRIAMCLEKLGEYEKAVMAYESFAIQFGDDKRADSARTRAGKIKAVQLNDPF